MTDRGLALLFAAALALLLLATLPLRLALIGSGVTASTVAGSLWHGRLADAGWHGLALGSVDVGLAPLPLLTGQRVIAVAGATWRGRVALASQRLGIEGLNGSAAHGQFAGMDIAALRLGDVAIHFDGGRCSAASGQISVQLGGPLAGLGSFVGSPRCAGDRLVLPLAAPAGRIEVSIDGAGRYAASLAIDSAAVAAQPGVLAAGLLPTPTGVSLSLQGQL